MKKIIVFLLLAIAIPCQASEVVVNGGWQHTANSNYRDGVSFNARVEQPVAYGFSGAVEYGYHGPTYHEYYGDFKGDSVLGEVIYYPPVSWKVKPYILGGLGWSWWSFDRDRDLKDRGIDVNLGDSFAKKAALGLDYPINEKWSLNIEWSYFHSHVPKDSYYESDGSYANVVGGDDRHGRITVGQEENQLTFGLRYKF